MVTLAECAVEYAEVGDNASEWVEYRVEDKCLQWSVVVALWCRDTLNDSLQNIIHTLTCLTRCQKNILLLAADKVDNLILHLIHHCRLNINLVKHGDNLQVVADSKVEV